MIIAITGMPGSGKSTVVKMLVQKGFALIEMHSVVYMLMRERGIEINTKNVEKFAVEERAKHGNGVFATYAAEEVAKMKGDVVIGGLRGLGEIDIFRKKLGKMLIIGITAPEETRYTRMHERTDDESLRVKDHEEMKIREEANKKMGVEGAIDAADFIIANVSTEADLAADVDSVLDKIRAMEQGKQ